MNKNIEDLFYDLWRTIISYLPNLFAGLLLLLVGWIIGWFVKRFIIQMMVILRFEKYSYASVGKAHYQKLMFALQFII